MKPQRESLGHECTHLKTESINCPLLSRDFIVFEIESPIQLRPAWNSVLLVQTPECWYCVRAPAWLVSTLTLSQKDLKLIYWLKVYDSNCVLMCRSNCSALLTFLPVNFTLNGKSPQKMFMEKDCFPVGIVSFLGALGGVSATWHVDRQAAVVMVHAVAYFYFLWF